MTALVYVEHEAGEVRDATLAAVTAAGKLGEGPRAGRGTQCRRCCRSCGEDRRVTRVLVADAAHLDHGLAENIAPIAAAAMTDYSAFVAASTTTGRNLAPRVAALLDVMQVSDILSVEDENTFTRPIYAGNAIATVRSSDAKKAAYGARHGVRKGGARGRKRFDRAARRRQRRRVEQFRRNGRFESERPELTSAKIIVSGGRALGSAEQFHALIDPLADKLGAAVGASRAAVDAGYAPNDYQVGQTGKIVAPEIYIAIGISGAIQHLAGMMM